LVEGLSVINALDADGIDYFGHGFVPCCPTTKTGPRNGNPDLPKKEGSQYRADSGEVKDGASRCGCSTLVQSPEKSSAIRKYAAIGRQY